MQIIIKTKNLEVAPADTLETFINKKIGGLSKFINAFQNHHLPVAGGRELFDAFVDVERETNHHRKGEVYKAEIKLYLPGKTVFAQASGDDLMKTIIDARDEMEGEIRKYKSKIVEFPRRQAKKAKQKEGF